MPLYEYKCDKCNRKFETFRTVEMRRDAPCPKCEEMSFKVISSVSTAVDATIRDARGTPIWYPKTGGKHYDRVLKKTFHSKREKADYMNEIGVAMDGSENPKKWPVESGDARNKSYRKSMEMED
jgi:putative FmdB family regulatory protein